MMFAMKVWVYITGNTLSQPGSDIVYANDVIVAVAFVFLCVCMLVFALVRFIRRANRVMVAVVVAVAVINDLF